MEELVKTVKTLNYDVEDYDLFVNNSIIQNSFLVRNIKNFFLRQPVESKDILKEAGIKVPEDSDHFSYMNIPGLFECRKYVIGLKDCKEYLEFGADKCSLKVGVSINDFLEFLHIDKEALLFECAKMRKNDLTKFGYSGECTLRNGHFPYTVHSRDRLLTMTISDDDWVDGYFHYFGMTGEKNRMIEVFNYFTTHCNYDELSFGDRDYI
jgi:hypothetical protein